MESFVPKTRLSVINNVFSPLKIAYDLIHDIDMSENYSCFISDCDIFKCFWRVKEIK